MGLSERKTQDYLIIRSVILTILEFEFKFKLKRKCKKFYVV